MSRREDVWHVKYAELKAYIDNFGQLPDKRRMENRYLLNWWEVQSKGAQGR